MAAQPFDLEKDAPLRVYLLARPKGHYLLLLTVHHIAVDFWSLLVMMDELRLLY
jgi:hypothetical protein